jgi:hypothetical protein
MNIILKTDKSVTRYFFLVTHDLSRGLMGIKQTSPSSPSPYPEINSGQVKERDGV